MNIRAKLVEICDAFNAHDLDRIMSFFADDCVLEMPKGSKPYGSRFEGKHNVREGLAARFEGLPDAHYGNAEHFVDPESQTGISKWCLTGTGRGGKKGGGLRLRLLHIPRGRSDSKRLVLENR